MKTSLVHCRTLTESFNLPCFSTSLSYPSIVARLVAFPELIGYTDIFDLQFQFLKIDSSGKRVCSHIYIVDPTYFSEAHCIRLLRVPKSESFF